MNGGWLALIVVCLVVGVLIGGITALTGLEMPWWSWVIVGVLVATIVSVWEAYRRRGKAPSQTGVEEDGRKSEE